MARSCGDRSSIRPLNLETPEFERLWILPEDVRPLYLGLVFELVRQSVRQESLRSEVSTAPAGREDWVEDDLLNFSLLNRMLTLRVAVAADEDLLDTVELLVSRRVIDVHNHNYILPLLGEIEHRFQDNIPPNQR